MNINKNNVKDFGQMICFFVQMGIFGDENATFWLQKVGCTKKVVFLVKMLSKYVFLFWFFLIKELLY